MAAGDTALTHETGPNINLAADLDEAERLYPSGATGDYRHIVDILIEERAAHLVAHPLVWSSLRQVLFPLLKYRRAVEMADQISQMPGLAALDWLRQTLRLDVRVTGHANIPKSGRAMIVANHPTGIADGIAVYQALKQVRDDISFFANSDALRVSPRFIETLIPVEWVLEKRTVAKTKLMLKRAANAFAANQAVVMFPSGRLARLSTNGLVERPWFDSCITMMRKYKAPIVPLNVQARNSVLFYIFSALNGELRDMTLFNEMLNKSNRPFRLTFGAPIQPDEIEGSPQEAVEKLKRHITEGLPAGHDWTSSTRTQLS